MKYYLITFVFSIISIWTYAQKQVHVNNVEDFLIALDDNTEIIITKDTLDLSTHNLNQYLHLVSKKNRKKIGVNYGLQLKKFNNLSIKSDNHSTLISNSNVDDILELDHCSNIHLENLILVHHEPATACEGNVLIVNNSKNITLDNCELNGSGAIGLIASKSQSIVFNNSKITNNTYRAVYLTDKSEAKFNTTIIQKNEVWENLITAAKNSKIYLNNCFIADNISNIGAIFSIDDSEKSTIICNYCLTVNVVENKKVSPSYLLEDANFRLSNNQINAGDEYVEAAVDVAVEAADFFEEEAIEVEEYIEEGIVDMAESITVSSSDENCRYISDNDLLRMFENGVDEYTIYEYCDLVEEQDYGVIGLDFTSKDDDIVFEKYMKKIINFLEWEDEKDNTTFYQLSEFYTFPLKQYWDKKNVSRADMEKIYTDSRKEILASKSAIQNIEQINDTVFEVRLVYCFMTRKNQKPQQVTSLLRFEFKGDKIKSVYPAK